jgi:hypothetical protein
MLLDPETAALAAVGNQPVPAEVGPQSAENQVAAPQQQEDFHLLNPAPIVAASDEPEPAAEDEPSAQMPNPENSDGTVPDVEPFDDQVRGMMDEMLENYPLDPLAAAASNQPGGAAEDPATVPPQNDIANDFMINFVMVEDGAAALSNFPALDEDDLADYGFQATIGGTASIAAESADNPVFPFLWPQQTPASHINDLFPVIPVMVDPGANTARVWCPTNMGGMIDPHWKEMPRNWNHPVSLLSFLVLFPSELPG